MLSSGFNRTAILVFAATTVVLVLTLVLQDSATSSTAGGEPIRTGSTSSSEGHRPAATPDDDDAAAVTAAATAATTTVADTFPPAESSDPLWTEPSPDANAPSTAADPSPDATAPSTAAAAQRSLGGALGWLEALQLVMALSHEDCPPLRFATRGEPAAARRARLARAWRET